MDDGTRAQRGRARGPALAAALAAGLTAAGWGAWAEDAPEPAPPRLVAGGESRGHLEPCHCVAGMLGGLPRRASALERLRAGGGPVLAVDLGDQTDPGQHHPGILRAKTEAAFELLERAGTAAVALGEHDLRLGVGPLRRLAERAGVTLLAANVRRGDERPFAARAEADLGGRPTWIAAVLDPDLGDPTGALEIDDPAAAARAALEDAPPGALRVLLFHGPRASALALPADLPVDVLVCGHEAADPGPLARHGEARVVETTRDGQRLAALALPPGDDPRLEQVDLDGRIPDAPWARRRVDAYYREVRGLPEEPRAPVREGGAYMGSESCRGCHQDAWAAFADSPHRRAQHRIAAEDERATLPECARCHVTGWGFESGFDGLDATPHLGEVGCEVCHGVGERHVMAPADEKRGYGVRTGFPESWRALCAECHHPPHTPDFDLDAALEQIKHWADR